MRGLATLGVVMCVACAPTAPGAEASRQAIYGGTVSLHDEAVFLFDEACTAVLIAPRTLLTAEHCLDGEPRTPARNIPNDAVVVVTEVRSWTMFAPDAGYVDLALAYLETAVDVTPLPWNWWTTRYNLGVDRIRHVGYGITESQEVNVRKQVTVDMHVARDSPAGFGIVTGDSAHGICFGDSGGPALLVPADGGPESIIGVHTLLAERECPVGFSTVLPPYRRFIEDWLKTHEDAGCPRDDRCVPGCQPVDQDCACVADGVCSADCIDLDDPDCPPFCGADGLCSIEPCALPDPDCNLVGGGCVRPAQCPGRECISDPQNPNKYCTQRCSSGLCPVGFQCDAARDVCIKTQLPYVENGGACTEGVNLCREFSQCIGGVCTPLCTSQLDCPKNWFCRETVPRICVAKDVVLRKAEVSAAAAEQGGCQAAPAGPLLLALLTACRTSRRRARTGRSA